MSNEAVFRCTTEGPNAPLRYMCCGERTDGAGCTCDSPPITAAERQRRARMKDESVEEFDDCEPPDAYAASIAARRAELGLPALPEQRAVAPVRAIRAAERPAFPLRPVPAGDPYEAQIQALRRKRGLERTSLPKDYRPGGEPPDPYAAEIERRRAAEVA